MSMMTLDGLYFRVEEAAKYIPDREIRSMAFDFSHLMYECERFLDGDITKEDWNKSLSDFKNKWFGKRNERLAQIIDAAVGELRDELLDMIGESEAGK